jgi:hypothetical protein
MLKENQEITLREHLEKIVEKLHQFPGVTAPSISPPLRKSRSSGIRKKNKVFAMISLEDRLAVKLPRERVEEPVAIGVGELFDPDHGWLMREWLLVNPVYHEKWLSLAIEAMEYVSSQG